MESIGSVANNIALVRTNSSSSMETFLHETVASKLYYLRDTVTPSEFEDLIEQEIKRSTSTFTQKQPKPVMIAKSIAKKSGKALKAIFCGEFYPNVYEPFKCHSCGTKSYKVAL